MAVFGVTILVPRQPDPPKKKYDDENFGNIKGAHKSLLMEY